MQREITAAAPSTSKPVHILGINQIGEESGNAGMCAGRVLPWLQDTAGQGVWAEWRVTFRDVFVVDVQNRLIRSYNLTVHDLSDSTNYAELKSILIGAAAR